MLKKLKLNSSMKAYKPTRTNTQKRCPFHYRGWECKSRKSRITWSSRLIWPWCTEWSRAKANKFCQAFDYVDQNKLWKILKEMGIPDHLTCLLRNLYVGQEATVRTRHGIADWFQIGKGVCQGCILSPCLFNLYAEYIMRNTGLDEAQIGIKIAEDCWEKYQ